MLHWTGGTGEGSVLRQRMANRVTKDGTPVKVSVHYNVGRDGSVYQFEDPTKVVCNHAGRVNDFSVGIEVTGPGTLELEGYEYETQTLKGRKVRVAKFGEAQVASVVRLVTQLCDQFGLPHQYPERFDEFPIERLRTFRGVIGHLQCAKKNDPGSQLFVALGAANFYAVSL